MDETADELYKSVLAIQAISVMDTFLTLGDRAVGMITGLRVTADPKNPAQTRLKVWRPLSPDLPRLLDFVRGREKPGARLRVTLHTRTRVDLVITASMVYETHGIETDITGDAETQRRSDHSLSHSNIYLDTLTLVTDMPLDVSFTQQETSAP